MEFLAISGSARQASTNTALLKFMASVSTDPRIEVFDQVGSLPVFSPDLEGENTPEIVQHYFHRIDACDGLIIACPEYVRSIPGGLKNAIDWLVSGEIIIHKPIALVHASLRGDDVLASLRTVLSTVSTQFAEQVFLRFPLMSLQPGQVSDFLDTEAHHLQIKQFLTQFRSWVRPVSQPFD